MEKIQLGKDNIELTLVAENDLVYPLKEEEIKDIKINISLNKNIELPIEKGQVVGRVYTYLKGVLIKEDNLVALDDVREKTIIDRVIDLFRRP